MSEWHPQVVKLGPVEPLGGSDLLSITQVFGGYPCIVKRGSFQAEDLAAYIPIDSVCDVARPEFAFLAKGGRATERIKAMRLRGTFSMGLLVPAPAGLQEGASVVDIFGLTKYEPPAPPFFAGEDEADPGLAPVYTDIEGLRRWPDILQVGEEVVITEKLHGECFRAVYDGQRLWVASRTKFKKKSDGSQWWRAAQSSHLENILSQHPHVVVYGEAHGYTGGFPYGQKRNTPALRIFDVMDGKTRKYYNHDDAWQFVFSWNGCSGDMVPELYKGPWYPGLCALAEGPSTIDPSHCREGIVIRPVQERRHPQCGRVILKLHGQEFLLRTGKSR